MLAQIPVVEKFDIMLRRFNPIVFRGVRRNSRGCATLQHTKSDATGHDTNIAKKGRLGEIKKGTSLEYMYQIFFVEEEWGDDLAVEKPSENRGLKFPEYGNKPKGPEPTRFGDWQYKGRSTDF
jgi:hypothetical protein